METRGEEEGGGAYVADSLRYGALLADGAARGRLALDACSLLA